MSDAKSDRNKATLKRFYSEFFTFPPDPNINHALLDELVREDYVQHNPAAGKGREGLRDFLVKVFPDPNFTPDWLSTSKQLSLNYIAEGDYVIRQDNREAWMLIDIFRFEDGQLAEHWDAWRPAPGYETPPGF